MLPGMLLLLLACSSGPDDTGATDDTGAPLSPEALVASLDASGPWAVGYTEQQVEYTDPAGQPRGLRLAAWYPTTDTEGEGVEYLGIVEDEGSWRDATVAPGPFPVIVFSHGSQGYAEVAGFLMRHLASHGWLVLSPDHTGNLITDGGSRSTEIYFQRPADISAVIDHAGAAWADTADLEVVVGMGHSFGGYTLHALGGATYAIEELAPGCYDGSDTSNFCSTMTPAYEAIFAAGLRDDRIDAILPVGAGDLRLFGEEGIATIDRPALWMAGELEGANAEAEQIFGVMADGTDRRVEVLGAGHNWLLDLSASLDLDATLPTDEGWRIARVFTLAWARRHGLGDATVDVVLDGGVEVSPQALLAQEAAR